MQVGGNEYILNYSTDIFWHGSGHQNLM